MAQNQLPRVRIELTTFRFLCSHLDYETDALPTALPRLVQCFGVNFSPNLEVINRFVICKNHDVRIQFLNELALGYPPLPPFLKIAVRRIHLVQHEIALDVYIIMVVIINHK